MFAPSPCNCRLESESSFVQEANTGRSGVIQQTDDQGNTDNKDNKDSKDNKDNKEKQERQINARVSVTPFKQTMNALWAPEDRELSHQSRKFALQNRFQASFEFFKSDPGHELSTVLASHPHLIHINSLGDQGHFTTGFALDKGHRKTHADLERYSIFLRESDVEVCPVGALAFYLLDIWTVRTLLSPVHCSLSLACISRATYTNFHIFFFVCHENRMRNPCLIFYLGTGRTSVC